MNRAHSTPSAAPHVSPVLLDEAVSREHLSALMDGEIEAGVLSRLLQEDGTAMCATWESYHLIGAVLRGEDRPEPADAARVAAIMRGVRASAQPAALAATEVPQVTVPSRLAGQEAANDAVFRWKLLAGFASVAAVVAVAWNMTGVAPSAQAPQWAQANGQQAPATVAVAQLPVAEPVVVQQGQQGAMLRDPRLEELMAAHRQVGGMSALQMPAGFLRNAAFDLPESQR